MVTNGWYAISSKKTYEIYNNSSYMLVIEYWDSVGLNGLDYVTPGNTTTITPSSATSSISLSLGEEMS